MVNCDGDIDILDMLNTWLADPMARTVGDLREAIACVGSGTPALEGPRA
jgi:hypothetical protein